MSRRGTDLANMGAGAAGAEIGTEVELRADDQERNAQRRQAEEFVSAGHETTYIG